MESDVFKRRKELDDPGELLAGPAEEEARAKQAAQNNKPTAETEKPAPGTPEEAGAHQDKQPGQGTTAPEQGSGASGDDPQQSADAAASPESPAANRDPSWVTPGPNRSQVSHLSGFQADVIRAGRLKRAPTKLINFVGEKTYKSKFATELPRPSILCGWILDQCS